MNLDDLRSATRTQLDLDETDLSNALLDLYIQEGFDRVVALETRWPFYEHEWTLDSTATGAITLPVDAREVNTVIGSAGRLTHIDRRFSDEYFVQSPVTGSSALFWTLTASTIQLWPQPNAVQTVTLRGYRQPTDWVAGGAGAEVDADRRLHYPIVHYACSLAMAQQEDEVLEATYLNRFRESVTIARDAIMRPWSGEPLILNSERFLNGRRATPALILDVPAPVNEFDGTIEGGTP